MLENVYIWCWWQGGKTQIDLLRPLPLLTHVTNCKAVSDGWPADGDDA